MALSSNQNETNGSRVPPIWRIYLTRSRKEQKKNWTDKLIHGNLRYVSHAKKKASQETEDASDQNSKGRCNFATSRTSIERGAYMNV